jgi:hypothetical protein
MTFTNLCGDRCSDFGPIDMISVIFRRFSSRGSLAAADDRANAQNHAMTKVVRLWKSVVGADDRI